MAAAAIHRRVCPVLTDRGRGTGWDAWYWSVIVFCAAFLIILGRRRIFRPGVERTADEISCRYIPWFEGNAYYVNLALPLTGAAMLVAGLAPGNPVWLRFGGGILLLFTPIFLDSAIRLWRKSILRITPSTLTVPSAGGPKFAPMELTRERVQAVAPKWVAEVSGAKALRVEISYHAADLTEPSETVLLGPQLTVEPQNLLDALLEWKDATADDPHELMDRIEQLLLGRFSAQV